MGSVHKQQKNLNEEVDKLSDLPDYVIGHILSFLPTEDAVRTCILSTRWKNSWKSISVLDLDYSLFTSQFRRKIGMQSSRFVKFVDRVMFHLKDSRLNKFRLQWYSLLKESDASHINSWISAALLNVGEIEISISRFKEARLLPRELFKCRKLVVLELSAGLLEVPNSVCLPNLKVLHLYNLRFYDEESCARLLSSSPVLEDLLLEECTLSNIPFVKIFSPGLKKFVLNGYENIPKSGIVLYAPQLEHLSFAGMSMEHGPLHNLHFLMEAPINFNWEPCSTTKVSCDLKRKSAVFPRLKTLEFSTCDVYDCSLMKDLVENLPQLESLFLCFADLLPLENITPTICKRLKEVKLNCFLGNSDDVEFVKHVLKNAKVLERFVIRSSRRCDLVEVHKELLAFPRASTSCRLVFY